MKANRGLGRGLDALMPEIPQEDARERVMMLRMGDIDPNPEQPRRNDFPNRDRHGEQKIVIL